MSGRVQGPPRRRPASLSTVVWTLMAIVGCLFSAYLSAHALVAAATWLYGLLDVTP